MLIFLAAAFLLALVISADSIPWIIRVARRRGFLDHPGPRKVHTEPVPYGGGLAVALGMLVTLAIGAGAAYLNLRYGWFSRFGPSIHAAGVVSKIPSLAVYAAGSLVILLLGITDDRKKLSPAWKLAVQFCVATGTVLGGERLSLFWEGSLTGDLFGGAITVLWIVGLTNAWNLLDHMDGLASGTALLVTLAFAAIAVQTGQFFLAAALAALAGSCMRT